LWCAASLAEVLDESGRSEEADEVRRSWVREALDGFDAWDGEGDFPALDSVFFALLAQIEDQGELQRRFVDSYRRRYGSDDPRTVEAWIRIAEELSRRQRASEAEPYARDVVESAFRMSGAGDELRSRALSALAMALRHLGRFDEALDLCERARPLIERRGTALLEVHEALLWLDRGECLAALGRFTEAERELLSVHELLTHAGLTPAAEQPVIRALAGRYERWHEADPSGGHDVAAAQWSARIGLERSPANR
jgi:tetratricopeptide (TPR) repeat protein